MKNNDVQQNDTQADVEATEAVADVSVDAVDTPADAAPDATGIDSIELGETDDSLTYANGVIEKIVAMATREVPHVLGMKGNLMHFVQETFGAANLTKGVNVEVTDDNRVVINISIIVEYGCYVPAIFEEVRAVVAERIQSITGLEVAGINLRIEDVLTREEYEASKKRNVEEGE